MIKFNDIDWTKVPLDRHTRGKMPYEAGVYCFIKDKTVLYIGKSTNLKSRVGNGHITAKRIKGDGFKDINVFYYKTSKHTLYEQTLIFEKNPKYNTIHTHDVKNLHTTYTKITYKVLVTTCNNFIKYKELTNYEILKKMKVCSMKTLIRCRAYPKQDARTKDLQTFTDAIGLKACITFIGWDRVFYIKTYQLKKFYTEVGNLPVKIKPAKKIKEKSLFEWI